MSLSLSSKGAAAERKLSTLAVFSEAPDGAERRGGVVAMCSLHSGQHIAAFLPRALSPFHEFPSFLGQLKRAA